MCGQKATGSPIKQLMNTALGLDQDPICTHEAKILAMCQPLFQYLSVNYFSLFRVEKGRAFYGLSSDSDWCSHFI